MEKSLRHVMKIALMATIPLLQTPDTSHAQAEAVSGLLDNATDFNFFWTMVGIREGTLKPERGSAASGVGFELAFDIPGGIGRKRTVPNAKAKPARTQGRAESLKTCEARFKRGELDAGQECADTTYKILKRTRVSREATYEEEPEVEEFEWEPAAVTFEVAVGFSQTGAFVPREGTDDMRVSIREAPTVSLYGNFPLSKERLAGYFGARTGLVQLAGGRAYSSDGIPIEFDGSTFQLGGVLGAVFEIAGLNFFAEGSYMLRDIKSIEWTSDTSIGTLPRSANLGGPSFAFGVQFRFKDAEKK